jgi:hypothetical protein
MADQDIYKICRAGGEVRTLRIATQKNGSCVTYYTKAGEDRQRASAKQFDVCLQVLTNIEKNLLENKWRCRDLTPDQIRVTSGNE